jgi:hypothetical protein
MPRALNQNPNRSHGLIGGRVAGPFAFEIEGHPQNPMQRQKQEQGKHKSPQR